MCRADGDTRGHVFCRIVAGSKIPPFSYAGVEVSPGRNLYRIDQQAQVNLIAQCHYISNSVILSSVAEQILCAVHVQYIANIETLAR